MSGRYGYDDKDVYPRRSEYGGRGSWDRQDRGDWDRDPHWDRGGPRDSRRDWDDRPSRGYEPVPSHAPHWDRRDMGVVDRDRMPPAHRDDWGRGNWGRPMPPPADREYMSRDRDRSVHDRNNMDWEPPAPRGPLVRKREPEVYDPPPRDFLPRENTRHPPAPRGGPEESDWKRRKVDLEQFDSGPPSHSNPSSEGQPPPHWENDQGQRRRLEPSEPSAHVIFLGMDPEFNETDLTNYLTAQGAKLESVTIIRDKITGLSRGFGFAQFTDVAGAAAFVGPNFPFVQLPPPASHQAPGYVPTPQPGGPRRVKIDFTQSAQNHSGESGRGSRLPGADSSKAPVRNDGTRDIGSAPTPVLLLRSLDKSTTIDEIAESLKDADNSNGDGAYGLRRIILICDRTTGGGLGFAFVEMLNIETASALLGAIMNPKNHPTGFRISSRIVAASFALPYAFQLLPHTSPKEPWCITPSQAVGGVEEGEGWTRYWDEGATIEEKKYEVKPKPKKDEDVLMSVDTPNGASNGAKAAPAPPPAPTALPSTGGAFSINAFAMKLKGAKPEGADQKSTKPTNALGFVADGGENGADEPTNPGDGTVGDIGENKPAPKVAPLAHSSQVTKNIMKWNQQVKEELGPNSRGSPAAPAAQETESTATPKPAVPDLKPGDPGFEYGDPVALTCLLCLRQLKSLQQLQRHNNESEMHKNNLKNVMLCKMATEKVASARRAVLNGTVKKAPKAKSPTDGSSSAPASDAAAEAPKYRDRAQERRRVHNQPDIPILPNARGGKGSPADTPPDPTSKPAPPVDVGKDENNIGNKMLKKMGWSEGFGLGTAGEGRAEPVKAAVFTSGAGIGASKGKEVTSFSATTAAEAAREAARERYEQA